MRLFSVYGSTSPDGVRLPTMPAPFIRSRAFCILEPHMHVMTMLMLLWGAWLPKPPTK